MVIIPKNTVNLFCALLCVESVDTKLDMKLFKFLQPLKSVVTFSVDW